MSGSKLFNRLRRRSLLTGPTISEVEEHGDADAVEQISVAPKSWRPSTARVRSSTLSGSLRIGKAKGARPTICTDDANEPLLNLFSQLPNELHSLILCQLSLGDLLSLRLSSRSLYRIVSQCESSVVRHHISEVCTPLETHLYPPPPPGEATLQYLLDWRHRKSTSRVLAGQLCNFVAREILRKNSAKKRREFDPTWRRMFEKLQPLIFTLNHFFEEYRRTVLERCAANSKAGGTYSIQTGPALWEDQTQIMDRYDPVLLLDLYHCYGFLLQAFERKLRPPSYAMALERYLRGWSAKPATAREIEILLMLGGMDKITWVLGHRRYSERRRALDVFIRSLSPKLSPGSWRDAWAELGVVSTRFSLDDVPTMRLAIPALHLIWVPNALHLLLAKDVIEHVDFGGDSGVRSMRDFVSEMVGYDILRYSSPPTALGQAQQDDDDDDDDDESETDETSEDEDSDESDDQ